MFWGSKRNDRNPFFDWPICFSFVQNVCELDLIFHVDKVHYILQELCLGGMVLETNMNEIVARIDEQNKLEKQEAGITAAPNKAMTAIKEMNLPQKIKDMKLPDLNINLRFWTVESSLLRDLWVEICGLSENKRESSQWWWSSVSSFDSVFSSLNIVVSEFLVSTSVFPFVRFVNVQ